MMMFDPSRRALLSAAALLLLPAAGVLARADEQVAAPAIDFAGVWELDVQSRDGLQALSQEALARVRAAGDVRRPGPTSRPGLSGQRGSAGRPGGSGRFQGIDGGRPEKLEQAPTARLKAGSPGGGLRSLARNLQRLLITHDGPRVEILDGSDRIGIWNPGGPEAEQTLPGGRTVRERAWWDGDVLVLERRGESFTLRQRLQRDPQDGALVVEIAVTVVDDAQPLRARLVYRSV